MIGQIVNYRYEVLEKIGDGQLFSVYRARDKVLNRLAALKVLSKDLCDNKEFALAVSEGYKDVAALVHPNIARVLDSDIGPVDCVVALEYARGTNVKDRITRAGSIAVSLALDIAIPVLEALEYAHANKVVHGDLRAQDIIVSPDGEVKVTDFGLSSALQKYPSIAQQYHMRSIHYQAPEVVEGGTPTAVSDVYSVGVVLYEMLTSTLPFNGGTAVSIALKKVKETAVPPRSINAAIPKTLNDIIMRSIETASVDRYQSASAMLADLRALRDALRVGHTVVPEQREPEVVAVAEKRPDEPLKRGFWLLLGLFVLTVLVMGGVTMLVRNPYKTLTVPPLLGKTWDEAVQEAEQKGFQLVDGGRGYSETYPAGTISWQDPAPGSTAPADKAMVTVKISNGPSQVDVPDLTGMSESAANEAAVKAGFMIGKVKEQYSDKVPTSAVISQDPPGGVKRAPGSAIDLVISLGPSQESPPPDRTGNNNAQANAPERRYDVSVEVPADEDGPQDVVVKVNDNNGESIAYEETHDPGEKFTIPVDTVGTNVRIRVYVGDTLVSDSRY